MIVVVSDLSYLILHFREFVLFHSIIYSEEIGGVQVFVQFDDWHNGFSRQIAAHHQYVNLRTVCDGEYFLEVSVSAVKIGGEENFGLRQVVSDFGLAVELKLNQSVKRQTSNVLLRVTHKTGSSWVSRSGPSLVRTLPSRRVVTFQA